MPERWACEGCSEFHTGEPAKKETYPGHRETVSLWFCDNCTTKP